LFAIDPRGGRIWGIDWVFRIYGIGSRFCELLEIIAPVVVLNR
jgi:hypothetical protein